MSLKRVVNLRSILNAMGLLLFLLSSMFISLWGPTLGNALPRKRSLHDFEVMRISGEKATLSQYQGKVLLITNIALKCGTTQQLSALESLYQEFGPKGLVVLGFPSGDFDPKKKNPSKEQVHEKCNKKYGVTFPLFSPAFVSGPHKQPVYSYLTENGREEIRGEVAFNFEKFLVDKSGLVRERFGAFTGANSDVMREKIEALLSE